MQKAQQFTLGLGVLVVAAAIASLVINVLVFMRYLDDYNAEIGSNPVKQIFPSLHDRWTDLKQRVALFGELSPPSSASIHVNSSKYCPSYGEALFTPPWKAAASLLRNAINESVDPCEDFFQFTCGSYITQHKEELSTTYQAQLAVNAIIAKALEPVDVDDEKQWSVTERITKAALQSCVLSNSPKLEEVLIDIANWFGSIPFLNHTIEEAYDVFETSGSLERALGLATLMESRVTVDYQHPMENALYISQPSLPLPRDYYVLPQFIHLLEERANFITRMLKRFATLVLDDPSPYFKLIEQAAKEIVNFEREMAMASWPDTEMREYAQQYNEFDIGILTADIPGIEWKPYLDELLLSVPEVEKALENKKIILPQPSYFGWLASYILGAEEKEIAIVMNYMITQLLFEEAEFIDPQMAKIAVEANYVPYAQRRGRGLTRIGRQFSRRFDNENDRTIPCLELIMKHMPYGPGYVYAKSIPDRDEIAAQVEQQMNLIINEFTEMIKSLSWVSARSKTKAREKADKMVRNIGWPTKLFGDFKNSSVIDAYHHDDYEVILELFKNKTDFYHIKHTLQTGFINREFVRLLTEPADRTHFLESPAFVSAWYQPERNSLTLPCSLWVPPFYNKTYPKAFNFGGHGAVVGHELVHGFDNEGVQFDSEGKLACDPDRWNQCTWMDKKSRKAFTDMSQCVITQYSSQCCPVKEGYVHCANGVTTQGENVADIGGLQPAYQAYVKLMGDRVEKRLPGLEQYTPKQLFWMYYAYSWCENKGQDSLITQLLTNPHSPASCRVDQVVQDIPEFSADFGCQMGQKMFPTPDVRCKVWVDN
uniref:Putative zinc metallopeptidase n=1 Tax=Haemonchus contortus TaxID=6289 RepID=O45131_HAECO|nr:putative zinc metallopeptidase precursor [Haemonchus contortus]